VVGLTQIDGIDNRWHGYPEGKRMSKQRTGRQIDWKTSVD